MPPPPLSSLPSASRSSVSRSSKTKHGPTRKRSAVLAAKYHENARGISRSLWLSTPAPSTPHPNSRETEDFSSAFLSCVSSPSAAASSLMPPGRDPAPSSASYAGHSAPSRTGTSFTSYRSKSRASSIAPSDQRDIIGAVCVARAGVTPSVGLAFVEIQAGKVTLSQISDNQSYVKSIHKIQVYAPSRVIISSAMCIPDRPSTLFHLLEEHLAENTLIIPTDRNMWTERGGLDYLHKLAFQDEIEPVKVALRGNLYATCAFCAVIEYLASHEGLTFSSNSLMISYQPSEDTMMIDVPAIQSLELLENIRGIKRDSLFGLLNHTSTPMGARLLRSNILQPPTLVEHRINPRIESVQNLTTDENLLIGVRDALSGFPDVDKFLSRLIIIPKQMTIFGAETAVDQVIAIKCFLQRVRRIYDALSQAKSELLLKIRDFCNPSVTDPILGHLSYCLNDDVIYSRQPLDRRHNRAFSIKPGINAMLDVARQAYKEDIERICSYTEQLSLTLGVQVRLKYNDSRKYYYSVSEVDIEGDLPSRLINVVSKGKNVEFQTLELRQLTQRVQDAANEISQLGDSVVVKLQGFLRSQVPEMYRVSEAIATLDMLAAFAHIAVNRGYMRPTFSTTLCLRNARHPILDQILPGGFIPNDYYASDDSHFQVITGCNMSGKSTYIRTIALLQIMAHIGSFVPAQYADFPLIKQIFARISLDDNLDENLSSFSVEMREMAFIMRNVNQHSIAIIDELGRGTSTRDGLAIAVALSEALIQSQAQVWFATHFTELAEALKSRPGVINLRLTTETTTTSSNLTKTKMLFKIEQGTVDDQNYGIALAKAVGFPAGFIEMAERVVKRLRDTRVANSQSLALIRLQNRQRLILNLNTTLKQCLESGMDEPTMANYLVRLQEEFIRKWEENVEHQVDEDEE